MMALTRSISSAIMRLITIEHRCSWKGDIGDTGEIQGRYRGEPGRCREDIGRCRGDTGGMRGRYDLEGEVSEAVDGLVVLYEEREHCKLAPRNTLLHVIPKRGCLLGDARVQHLSRRTTAVNEGRTKQPLRVLVSAGVRKGNGTIPLS